MRFSVLLWSQVINRVRRSLLIEKDDIFISTCISSLDFSSETAYSNCQEYLEREKIPLLKAFERRSKERMSGEGKQFKRFFKAASVVMIPFASF